MRIGGVENAIRKRNSWGEIQMKPAVDFPGRGVGGVSTSPSTGQQSEAEQILALEPQQWQEAGGEISCSSFLFTRWRQ